MMSPLTLKAPPAYSPRHQDHIWPKSCYCNVVGEFQLIAAPFKSYLGAEPSHLLSEVLTHLSCCRLLLLMPVQTVSQSLKIHTSGSVCKRGESNKAHKQVGGARRNIRHWLDQELEVVRLRFPKICSHLGYAPFLDAPTILLKWVSSTLACASTLYCKTFI